MQAHHFALAIFCPRVSSRLAPSRQSDQSKCTLGLSGVYATTQNPWPASSEHAVPNGLEAAAATMAERRSASTGREQEDKAKNRAAVAPRRPKDLPAPSSATSVLLAQLVAGL